MKKLENYIIFCNIKLVENSLKAFIRHLLSLITSKLRVHDCEFTDPVKWTLGVTLLLV